MRKKPDIDYLHTVFKYWLTCIKLTKNSDSSCALFLHEPNTNVTIQKNINCNICRYYLHIYDYTKHIVNSLYSKRTFKLMFYAYIHIHDVFKNSIF